MQSPGRLFAHWDVSPAAVDEVRRELGRRATALARLALRITAAGASRPLVVLLPRGARSWYVDVPGQRHEYRADLGLMLPSGEFRVLASSNVLRMPRTSPSPRSAGARVAFDRTRPAARAPVSELPPETPPAGEAFAAEVGTAEPSGSGEASAPGGSSELSARSGPRRAERVPPPGAVEADLGGASELFPRGSSSDLRRRR
jgi:hypothetical protein